MLVDLERRRVIDLLPDREAATFAAWLTAHPGVEIVSRDRGGAYAEGARQGAPEAMQVADRFHLVHNLVDALERACTRHHGALRAAGEASGIGPRAPASGAGAAAGPPGRPYALSTDVRRSTQRRAKRRARYERVIALRAAGASQQRIARAVGLTRGTVARWLAAGDFPEWAQRPPQPRVLDAFRDDVVRRYDAGLDDATQLLRALRPLGFMGSYQAVRRYLGQLRRTRPRAQSAVPASADPSADGSATATSGPSTPEAAPPAALERLPSPRATAWLLRKDDAVLTAAQRAYVTALWAGCPALAEASTLGREFVRLLQRREMDGFDGWLTAAARSELRTFAAGLQRDQGAVRAAFTSEWSNGQVEGQVNRLKLTKRAMFGRAGFESCS